MKTRTLLLTGLLSVSLSACGSTFEGLKKDFNSMGSAVGSKVDSITTSNETLEEIETAAKMETATAIMNDGTCPPISVDPQLNSMSEFYNPEKPEVGTEVSTLDLTGTKSMCQIDGEYLEVQVELNFAGQLGPKAKRKDGDRPFFAYPYFVAVTDNEDNELAKELFAASVTYETNQDKIELIETIRQKLPLNDDGSVPPYQIKIGFQLTDEQLFHNASR